MKTLLLAQCIAMAFPGTVSGTADPDVISVRGTPVSLSERPRNGDPMERVSIEDMLLAPYGTFGTAPNADPGRLRPDNWMRAMHGNPAKAKLQNVKWIDGSQARMLPAAADALDQVRREIEHDPALARFAGKNLGTYNYRTIAGTKRLSAHAYGLAIDLHFPGPLHRYWQWDGKCSEKTRCTFPKAALNHPELAKTVAIFEKHGFIWGGQWNHYDIMHFEWRPEILACAGKTGKTQI